MSMLKSNYHSHCNFCDGRDSMEAFVKYAIILGLKKYGFSSHAPLSFHTSWNMIDRDFEAYKSEFTRLKMKYKNEIDLYLGLEIDYIDALSGPNDEYYQQMKLDYAIGSVHYLNKMQNGNYWSIDGSFEEFKAGLNELFDGNIQLATKRFFEVTNKMIGAGGFDIVGHLDKITLHGTSFSDFDIRADWYKTLFFETLDVIKQKRIIVEVNVKSFYEKNLVFPDSIYFEQLKAFDIPLVVNSDCHHPTKIAGGIAETIEKLKIVGYTELQNLSSKGWYSSPI